MEDKVFFGGLSFTKEQYKKLVEENEKLCELKNQIKNSKEDKKMKKYEKLKMDMNSAYGAAVIETMMNSKEFKNLKKVLDSGYVTSYPSYLSDRDLIGKIFYYSGRALQSGNICHLDDLETLHHLIMEYDDRCKHYRR